MGASARDERDRSRVFEEEPLKETTMKNWKLVTVTAAALSALVFAAACTVEEGDPEGTAGAAGTGGSAAAGTGGSTAAGAGGEAGAAGAATSQTFADAFRDDTKADGGDCTKCLNTNCATEVAACGDVSSTGTGACSTAVGCLASTYKETDPNYNCAFESCAAANPQPAVNDAFTCTGEKCATECFVTAGFTCN